MQPQLAASSSSQVVESAPKGLQRASASTGRPVSAGLWALENTSSGEPQHPSTTSTEYLHSVQSPWGAATAHSTRHAARTPDKSRPDATNPRLSTTLNSQCCPPSYSMFCLQCLLKNSLVPWHPCPISATLDGRYVCMDVHVCGRPLHNPVTVGQRLFSVCCWLGSAGGPNFVIK